MTERENSKSEKSQKKEVREFRFGPRRILDALNSPSGKVFALGTLVNYSLYWSQGGNSEVADLFVKGQVGVTLLTAWRIFRD